VTAPRSGPASAADRPPSMSRGDRIRDLVALVLVVAGIGLVVVSHSGMQGLATQAIVVRPGEWAMSQYMHFRYLELTGYALAIVGIVVGVVSYLVRARRNAAGVDRTTKT
jgi:hypothetical protein